MSSGHSGIVFRVLCPKISTGQEKLAPTGLHGLHVFATLHSLLANRLPSCCQRPTDNWSRASFYSQFIDRFIITPGKLWNIAKGSGFHNSVTGLESKQIMSVFGLFGVFNSWLSNPTDLFSCGFVFLLNRPKTEQGILRGPWGSQAARGPQGVLEGPNLWSDPWSWSWSSKPPGECFQDFFCTNHLCKCF